jgi:hypothetical protein
MALILTRDAIAGISDNWVAMPRYFWYSAAPPQMCSASRAWAVTPGSDLRGDGARSTSSVARRKTHRMWLLRFVTHGKITGAGIREHLHDIGNEHHVQPRAIDHQATEYGTVHATEIRAIADFACNSFCCMDGARIFNAAAHLDVP